MGESTYIDLDRLRHLVGRISAAAAEVADMRCAELDPAALPGSSVGASVASAPIVRQMRDIAENLREWAIAARTSADGLERADTAGGDRFPLR